MDSTENGDNSESMEQKGKRSFDDLPVDIRRKIISYLPARRWPKLELVSRGFRNGTLASWSSLKKVDSVRYFDRNYGSGRGNERKENFRSLMRMIYNRAPNIASISISGGIQLDSGIMVDMAKFRKLESVSFSYCAVGIGDLAMFLAQSESRCRLEELIVFESLPAVMDDKTVIDDLLLRQAFIDAEGRPPLQLRIFQFENYYKPQGLLSALNAGRLEKLKLKVEDRGGSYFPGHDVVELLGRCTELKELIVDLDQFTEDLDIIMDAIKLFPCRSLQKLKFRCGHFNDTSCIPVETLRQWAYRHPELEILNLRWEKFEPSGDALFIIAQDFKNLTEFRFDVGQIESDVVTAVLSRMERLERLYLHNQLYRYANVDYHHVVDILLTVATSMKRLTKLHVDLPGILSHEVTVLLQLTQLRELSICVNRDVNDGLALICHRLEPLHAHLDLDVWEIGDHQLVFALENKTTRIRRLKFGCSSYFTNVGLQAIANACPLLEELNLSCDMEITASGIRDLIRKCKKMTVVTVPGVIPGVQDLFDEWPGIINFQ